MHVRLAAASAAGGHFARRMGLQHLMACGLPDTHGLLADSEAVLGARTCERDLCSSVEPVRYLSILLKHTG